MVCDDINARFDATLLTRLVEGGQQTILEKDDWAKYVRSRIEAPLVRLVPRKIFELPSYRLVDGRGIPVMIEFKREAMRAPLSLPRFEDAARLLTWLRGKAGSGKVGNAELKIGDRVVSPELAGALEITSVIGNTACLSGQ